ncbi:MAG: FkbM family methyltransferase, partial [Paracoccaceae bacterium]|nr:FkbM family methyltransferase [Paracoccaceae bacterium]
MAATAKPPAEKRWYELGLGLRTRFGSLYQLLRFAPGGEGQRAYTLWLDRLRKNRMQATMSEFDRILAGMTPDSIALDLGAHQGEYTAKLAATGAQVHAFEPEPMLFAALQERFADTPNVILHQAAIAAEAGRMTLHVELCEGAALPGMSNTLVEGHCYARGGPSIEVECVDFFAFLDSLGSVPAVVKMDIEGAEVPILERVIEEDLLNRIGMLFVETHERQVLPLRQRTIALHRHIFRAQPANVNLLWP